MRFSAFSVLSQSKFLKHLISLLIARNQQEIVLAISGIVLLNSGSMILGDWGGGEECQEL